MIKHLLFDLDDTLYSNSAGLMQEINVRMNDFMVTRLGVSVSEVSALRQHYWLEYGTTLRGLYLERHIDAQAFLDYVHDIRIDRYLLPDEALGAMLAQLAPHRYIFTNAPESHARRVLDALGIARHFERIFDINFIAYESKPAPSAYRKVLDALGATASECLMIDDSARNLLPAKGLGMRTVLLDGKRQTPDGEPVEGIDHVITTIHAFGDLLARLDGSA